MASVKTLSEVAVLGEHAYEVIGKNKGKFQVKKLTIEEYLALGLPGARVLDPGVMACRGLEFGTASGLFDEDGAICLVGGSWFVAYEDKKLDLKVKKAPGDPRTTDFELETGIRCKAGKLEKD